MASCVELCFPCNCDIYSWWGGARERNHLSINLAAPEKVGVKAKLSRIRLQGT